MPTFTAISLDRLLEPCSRPPPQTALYATPESTPLPDSPSSFPPSPFIVNHKRRGPRLLKTPSHTDVAETPPPPPAAAAAAAAAAPVDEEVGDGDGDGVAESGDDFFEPGDTMSVVSSDSNGDGGTGRVWRPGTQMGEFFDAFDEITSEGTPQSFSQNVEDELREMRIHVLMEIERRKQAEETLEYLQNEWHRLSHQLSLVGLVLPNPPTNTEEINGQSNLDPAEELCQQVVIARFVANSIGRGSTRAEIEQEIEPLIETKNFEIARLWDRLQYYEVANREMSQRNQEAVEMARQQRHKRKRRQKWLWGALGLTVSLGASVLAWNYLPHSKAPSADEVQAGAETDGKPSCIPS